MKIRTFQKGEVIFYQGDDAQQMFDILSGSVGVYVGYGTKNETKLTVLKSGDFLGEMGLIERYPRSATAVAEENETALQEIGAAEFSSFFRSPPARRLVIMQQLGQRLRDRTEDYEAARLVLEGLRATRSEPEKRSQTLLEKAKAFLAYYEDVMNTAYNTDNWSQIPYNYLYRERS